jgi:hypothetical protein
VRRPGKITDVRLRRASLALVLAAWACAGTQEPVDPQALACMPAKEKIRASDFETRLSALKGRAARVAACMEQRGFTLDEDRLARELEHFEDVKNADPLGGDPWQAVALREQELRASPHFWRRETTQ